VTGRFAAATAITAAHEGDPGRWNATVHEGFDIGGNANGGYLLAIAGRALCAATDRPDPVTVTAHYLTPGKPGPVVLDTDVVKRGKRFTTARATVRAADRPVIAVLATLGDLSDADGPELIEAEPPDLPPPDACVRSADRPSPHPFMDKVDLRLHPEDAGFSEGRRSGRPLVRGWFRLPDDEPVDTVALLCAVDAFPPTIFNAHLPVAWTPTVELTAHVRARPEPGWLRCVFRTRFVSSGFLEADGELWDEGGRLVAQSRQLALVPRPPAAG
jgi:acyl-CoA thioesterase